MLDWLLFDLSFWRKQILAFWLVWYDHIPLLLSLSRFPFQFGVDFNVSFHLDAGFFLGMRLVHRRSRFRLGLQTLGLGLTGHFVDVRIRICGTFLNLRSRLSNSCWDDGLTVLLNV